MEFLRLGKKKLPEQPIKPEFDAKQRIPELATRLKILQERLERSAARLRERDKALFENAVQAEMRKDHSMASIYAGEMSQIRKFALIIMRTSALLEQIILRLETVKDFVDFREIMKSGELALLKTASEDLRVVMPEVSMELSNITQSLDEIMVGFGEVRDYGYISTPVTDEETQKILKQISEIAVQRMKNTFPELPQTYKQQEADNQSPW